MKGINLEELPPEVKRHMQRKAGIVPERLLLLGKILSLLESITKRDALWALRKAIKIVESK